MYPERRNDITNLLILLLVASTLGIYLIATTVIISKDGVTYIELAKVFSTEPLRVVKGDSFGYSSLIFAGHTLASLFKSDSSVLTWIYAGQSITLICRVLALFPLYFIGKLLVGSRKSFWAIVILIFLPYPAEFGSDVLRDWPHILFLAGGLLFLLRGAERGKGWMFGGVGFAAGLGQMVRPECAQLMGYGVLWMLMRLFVPTQNMNRCKSLCALTLLFVCFAIPTIPYMIARGDVLPEELRPYLCASALWGSEKAQEHEIASNKGISTASNSSWKAIKGIGRLAGEMTENLMYYFVPALALGIYARVRRKHAASVVERFFIPTFVFLNVLMVLLLYMHWGYISRRHCLPLLVILIFYVPSGLELLANGLEDRFSGHRSQAGGNSLRWFFILLVIGMGICMPKLLRPMGVDKWGFRAAATWLKKNTDRDDLIAVPDMRISFYAEREGRQYTSEIPEGARYVVRIVGSEKGEVPLVESEQEEFSVEVDKRERSKKRLLIYRII